MDHETCELCQYPGGEVLWQGPKLRIVRISNPDYPGFCRVIWNAHVREMTDLTYPDRQLLMSTVLAVEAAVREVYRPHKINLASLGNKVSHLHWHIIPRWEDDRHFPEPIWGETQRSGPPANIPTQATLDTLNTSIHCYLAAIPV